MNKPDFLIVGAAKSGTSSLHYYLSEHPEIYLHKYKELNFWHLFGHEEDRAILRRYDYLPTSYVEYCELFSDSDQSQITGDISPSYLYYYNDTIFNIKQIHPEWKKLKIIIILREPIDKIWSHYKFVRNKKLDPDHLSLWDSLMLEESRIHDKNLLPDLFYVANTRYTVQVKSYLNNFPNTLILLYDDLLQNTKGVLDKITDFLGVHRGTYVNIDKRYNASSPIKVERGWVERIRGNMV